MRLGGKVAGFERLFEGGAGRPTLTSLAREAAALLRGLPDPSDDPQLAGLPRGDGHPVLTLPAFLHGDGSTRSLRRLLHRLGYPAWGWDCGINLGPTERIMRLVGRRISEARARDGRRVSLIGHSMGGIFAREFAKLQPDDVRCVVTLCSPFRPPIATNVELLFRLSAVAHARDLGDLWDRIAMPPPVPSLAVFSREDGIVNWPSCTEAEPSADHRNLEVGGPHSTVAKRPEVVRAIALFLAEAERRIGSA